MADLLVTVDFEPLWIPSNSLIDIASNSVQVQASLTNNTADVLAMTRPTILIPGVNLVGLVSMEIHQTFKNPGVATLGIFEVRATVMIGAWRVYNSYLDVVYATNPRGTGVLFIPRSINFPSHPERCKYLNSSLERRERLHTVECHPRHQKQFFHWRIL